MVRCSADRTASAKDVNERVAALPDGETALQTLFGKFIQPGRSEEDRIAAVHYVRFPLTPADIAWWGTSSGEVSLEIRLPHYQHTATMQAAMRASLARDFD